MHSISFPDVLHLNLSLVVVFSNLDNTTVAKDAVIFHKKEDKKSCAINEMINYDIFATNVVKNFFYKKILDTFLELRKPLFLQLRYACVFEISNKLPKNTKI